jgi:LuxR family maltose regulon positive regulatory protein
MHKVIPPVPSPYAIERTGIMQRLQTDTRMKVALVCAPAGYGKTTTLAQLLRHLTTQGADCAWLDLDEGDNDVSRFMSSMQRALAGAADLSAQRAPARSAGDHAEDLLERMSQRGTPFVFFIDNMHAVTSPAVLALVAAVVDGLPPRAMLVIGSRNVPDVGLARLRANGDLVEIGPHLLRLSAAETREFIVSRRNLPLRDEQVAQLHSRTEGWITALWLASLALEQCPDAAQFVAGFSGSSTTLAEYFAKVVLAAQSESIRDFLLETCILDELTPAACDAVRGAADSARLLAQAADANLFVAASDENRSAYRCHALFAGFLRAHLQADRPARVPALQRAASQWFLSQGRPLQAISHALHAGPDARALDLLQRHADGLLRQGRVRLLARWLDPLPAETLASHPQLRVAHAWAVAFTRGAHEALMPAGPAPWGPEGNTDLATLQALLWFMSDRVEEAHAQALENLPRAASRTGFASAMAAQTLANTCLAKGRFTEARDYADLARRSHGDAPSPFHLALAESVEGAVDLVQGRLRSAIVRLRSAYDENRGPGARLFGFPFPGTLLAEALYEAGDVEFAQSLLRGVAPLLLDIALPDQLITAHVLLARIHRARGEAEGALASLETLEAAGHRLRLPRAVACARLERAWGHVDDGDFAEAQRLIDRSGRDEFWAGVDAHCHGANEVSSRTIAQARLLIRRGSARSALPELRRELALAEGAGRLRRALKLRILLAEALHADGDRRLAMRQLGLALEFAAREGWVQTFVEEGPSVSALLAKHAESARPEARDNTAPITELLQRAMAPRGELPSPTSAELREALTAKERRVLQLLAGGDSNEAIAGRLFVSRSTVRTHLRSINAKLNAHSRTQAVAIGRRLGLID